MSAWHASFDPLFPCPERADDMVRIAARFGSYKMYSEEPTFAGIGEGLPARWDAARNFVKSGGRFARHEPLEVLAARTNYFRETYAYGEDVRIEGIEPFLHHEAFVEAARRLYGRPVIEPAIVYANLLVPGQELAIHTDVPEFRGVNRQKHPQWLIVAMHHSGLFAPWRMPIATAVAWFHDCAGGAFAFYPDGADGDPVAQPVRRNTAILLDTDSVFHGVDRVAETAAPVGRLHAGMRLRFIGEDEWVVTDGEREVARHRWQELRFSISWKAYCFADEREQHSWREHADDLSVQAVVDRLLADMKQRGAIAQTERLTDHDLVERIIDTYIRFPPALGTKLEARETHL
jgi:hypothetical protein